MSQKATIKSAVPGSDRAVYLMRAEKDVYIYAPYGVDVDPAALFDALARLGFTPEPAAALDDGWTECTWAEYDAAAVKGTPRRIEYRGYPATPPEPQLPTEPGATIWAREVRGIRYEGDGKGWLLIRRDFTGVPQWASGIRIADAVIHSTENITDWEPAVVS